MSRMPGAGPVAQAHLKGRLRGLLSGAALLALLLAAVGSMGGGSRDASAGPQAAPVFAEPAPLPMAAAAGPPARSVADFGSARPSPESRALADWVAGSRDNASADFFVIDKKRATLFVFDASARLRASSPVLLGAARGDDSVPGIGERPLALVQPYERTTPAGRFVAERGRNAIGDSVVWVDYDAAVSMHRVRTSQPAERRLERLATPSIADNRISYGCINVPVAFFESVVKPVMGAQRGVVYVLPETKDVRQVFAGADPVEVQMRRM